MTVYIPIRCPYCNRLAAEVSEGAAVRLKCGRCGAIFERSTAGEPPSTKAQTR